jgi:hypothetical protein
MGCAEFQSAEVRIGSRDAERVRVVANGLLRAARSSCPVFVYDLSRTGARIASQRAWLEPSEIVHLELPFHPIPLQSEVMWSANGTVGMRFFEPLDPQTCQFLIKAMTRSLSDKCSEASNASIEGPPSRNSPEEYQRQVERAEIALGASCRTEIGRRTFVAMIDLTPQGCCLYSRALDVNVKQKLYLQPVGLAPLGATVQWKAGSLIGVQFDAELYPAVFEHLAEAHPWPLAGSAKAAMELTGDGRAAAHSELVRIIERAEKQFLSREQPKDVLTTRPLTIGSRPGLSQRAASGNLARLFWQ